MSHGGDVQPIIYGGISLVGYPVCESGASIHVQIDASPLTSVVPGTLSSWEPGPYGVMRIRMAGWIVL